MTFTSNDGTLKIVLTDDFITITTPNLIVHQWVRDGMLCRSLLDPKLEAVLLK